MNNERPKTVSGKWAVVILVLISLLLAILRWTLIPKTNPREADPGNPFYSPPVVQDAGKEKAAAP